MRLASRVFRGRRPPQRAALSAAMSWDAPQLSGSLLVAGCYERFLFGLDTGSYDAPALKKARLRCVAHPHLAARALTCARRPPQVFTLEAHMSGVKCLAGAGGFIASGGGDDLVRCAPRSRRPRAQRLCASQAAQRSRPAARTCIAVLRASARVCNSPLRRALRCARRLRALRRLPIAFAASSTRVAV